MVSNATQFVEAVGNGLGWSLPGKQEMWKEIRVEASKVIRKQRENPALFTWPNCELAIQLCRRERRVMSPVGVMWQVERAVRLAEQTDVAKTLDVDVLAAIASENSVDDPYGWATRLTRAFGKARQEVFQEWSATRRHLFEGETA